MAPSTTNLPPKRSLARRFAILALVFTVTVFYAIWCSYLVLTATDSNADPIKVDFLSYYAGSEFVLDGEPADAYDARLMYERQLKLHGDEDGSYAWLYPPTFFFFVLPLALVSVNVSLFVWFATTGGALLAALRRISANRLVLLLALGFPATYWNFVTGQNGLLTAALLAWGVVLLRDRPVVAGAVLGLLIYKPQFFPLVLVALVAGRHRNAAVAAITSAALLSLATLPAFGIESWEAFISVASERSELIYAGGGDLQKMQSLTGLLLVAGVPPLATQLAQGALAVACAVFVAWLWRRELPLEYRAAGLALAILLASPYSYHYDLTLLGLAALWLGVAFQREGWRPSDIEVLGLAWLAPLVAVISARALDFTIGPLVLLLMIAVLLRRVRGTPRPTVDAPAPAAVPA